MIAERARYSEKPVHQERVGNRKKPILNERAGTREKLPIDERAVDEKKSMVTERNFRRIPERCGAFFLQILSVRVLAKLRKYRPLKRGRYFLSAPNVR
jgi:hypothetical protein